MDILLLILLAAGVFALGLMLASLWSVGVAWRKAAAFGLSINFFEARALARFYQLEEGFLQACLTFQTLDSSVSIRDIVNHRMADGDTDQLLSHWKKVKLSKRRIPFKTLVLYDLSGKNVDDLIQNFEREYVMTIPEITERGLSVSYTCTFRIQTQSSGWVDPDLEDFQQTIREKIILAVLAADISDSSSLACFIEEEYLHDEFWKNLCHGEIIEQQIRITKT